MAEDNYSAEEQALLLQFIRETIAAKLQHRPAPFEPDLGEKLTREGSCFVTLHSTSGRLRGCIGNIMAYEPLGKNIAHNALNAAFRDPRFPPLSEDELTDITLELSILTPMRHIDSPDEFEIGRHGIVMNCRGRSAVFLPQVAPEQGWDKKTTLRHLCLKANLPHDAWQLPDAKFQIFEAIVFSEKQ